MERYSLIETKMPREFVLLQGTGCRWRHCTFCDYHTDIGDNPYEVNREALSHVTGRYGVLDVINSGSAIELDEQTIWLIQQIVREKAIHTLWFEMHWMYRNRLAEFALRFAPACVKYRCGIETFNPELRKIWRKGVGDNVTATDVARYFDGVCLLCCTQGDSRERIISDLAIARRYFEYMSVNLFCNNSTDVKSDEQLVKWFIDEVYPQIKDDRRIEILLNNTDLGVG